MVIDSWLDAVKALSETFACTEVSAWHLLRALGYFPRLKNNQSIDRGYQDLYPCHQDYYKDCAIPKDLDSFLRCNQILADTTSIQLEKIIKSKLNDGERIVSVRRAVSFLIKHLQETEEEVREIIANKTYGDRGLITDDWIKEKLIKGHADRVKEISPGDDQYQYYYQNYRRKSKYYTRDREFVEFREKHMRGELDSFYLRVELIPSLGEAELIEAIKPDLQNHAPATTEQAEPETTRAESHARNLIESNGTSREDSSSQSGQKIKRDRAPSALTQLIERTYIGLQIEIKNRKITLSDILLEMQNNNNDEESIIQEIDHKNKQVSWCDPATRADRRPTSFKRIQNIISEIRRDPTES
ncbi:MAG: hypothetical protein HQM06_13180 [Magnetococcales bacterium]|nr:hypothetical protein [Magnetococcales bacterium]